MSAMNVFRFVLALGLAPVVLGIARRIRIPEAQLPFLVGFIAIVAGFGMAAGQPLWDTIALRALRHVTFAVGGFGLAWAAWQARRHVLASAGDGR